MTLRTRPKAVRTEKYEANGQAFTMIKVQGGTFDMGDEHGDLGDSSRPVRQGVRVTDFELGRYPVTQALWQAVMGDNPSHFKGAERPVEQVSWDAIVKGVGGRAAFLDALNGLEAISERNGLDGKRFRLPSEAQWEYAARGGRFGQFFPFTHAGSNRVEEVAWFGFDDNTAHGSTEAVHRKQPNALGLYDMSGNVWEWCADAWHDNYESAPPDDRVWDTGGDEGLRVVRGGSWVFNMYDCRVAYRFRLSTLNRLNDYGFRLARY